MVGTEVDAATDVEAFARAILGRPLWPHQVELLRSPARYRVVTAGRQSGKSTALSTEALFTAATRRNALVLVVSAGEVAARRLLADAADIAQASPLLRGSVLDETKGSLSLSNGSQIISVPASQRQIRGWATDLLIVDEAGFVDPDVWRAAEPSIIARPGSRVILSSSPWGSTEHFFRALWQRGMDSPDGQVAAWHWPSSISPVVDAALLEGIRQREPADYFAREYLAEWADASGAYFSEEELMRASADYELVSPEQMSRGQHRLCGGVDWGVSRDANALVLLGMLDAKSSPDGRCRFYVPWLVARSGWPWSEFLEYLERVVPRAGVWMLASETNGVGAWPTDDLSDRLFKAGTGAYVAPVWTDVRRKQSGFGKIRMLLQTDRLVLPRHPELLKQLRALEFEQLPGGGMRIAVPERAGHDDLAMALLQAVSCVRTNGLRDPGPDDPFWAGPAPDDDRWIRTGGGVLVPRRPTPFAWGSSWITGPAGAERGEGW